MADPLAITCGSPPDGEVGVPYGPYTLPVTGGTPPYNFNAVVSRPTIRGSKMVSSVAVGAKTLSVPLTALDVPTGGTANASAGDFAIVFAAGSSTSFPSGFTNLGITVGATWPGFGASKILSSGDISGGVISVDFNGDPAVCAVAILVFQGATGGIREVQSDQAAGGTNTTIHNTSSGAVLNTDAAVYFATVRTLGVDVLSPTISPDIGAASVLQVTLNVGSVLGDQQMPGGAIEVANCFPSGAGAGCWAAQVIVESVPSESFPLPPGLELNSVDGIISGTPTTPGVYSVTTTVTDTSDCATSTVTCEITILGELEISCDSPPQGKVEIAYTHAFPATGGTLPYTWGITAGTLPGGLALDTATGVVSGTPTVVGIFPFTIQVTDADAQTADVECSITIIALTISCNNPPNGFVGVNYTHTFAVTNGVPPLTFFILTGALPDGIVLDPVTGVIFGEPTSAGIFGFTVRVTDSLGLQAVTGPCSITITNPIPPPPPPPSGLVATSLFWCLISASLTLDTGTT